MKLIWRLLMRFHQVRAARLRARAVRADRTAEKFFRRGKGVALDER